MKKIGLILCIVFVLTTLAFVGCQKENKPETEEQMKGFVDAAMTAVMLPVNVTENLTLPSMSGTVAISWTSDKADVVSNTGTVNRPSFGEDDVEVKLTGSFSYKDYSDTKVYTLKVKSIKDKVFTFAGGHTGDNAIFTAPEDGTYGSITDKGDGVITLKPTELEGSNNAPYFRISQHMPAFEGGFESEIMIYIDHEQMTGEGSTLSIDFSLSDEEGELFGSAFFTLAVTENNVVITQNQRPDTEKFVAMPGWYTIGMRFFDNDGKLHGKGFIKDLAGAELHVWNNTKFKGFNIEQAQEEEAQTRTEPETEPASELVDISTAKVAAPRSMALTNMNIDALDVKQVRIAYID